MLNARAAITIVHSSLSNLSVRCWVIGRQQLLQYSVFVTTKVSLISLYAMEYIVPSWF